MLPARLQADGQGLTRHARGRAVQRGDGALRRHAVGKVHKAALAAALLIPQHLCSAPHMCQRWFSKWYGHGRKLAGRAEGCARMLTYIASPDTVWPALIVTFTLTIAPCGAKRSYR